MDRTANIVASAASGRSSAAEYRFLPLRSVQIDFCLSTDMA
jgi:hypothetical protein